MTAKALLGVLSLLVLAATGYGWATYHKLEDGITRTEVIDGPPPKPDGPVDILLVGNDSRTDAQGNPLPPKVLRKLRASDDEGGDLTDTLILVHIPANGEQAVAISMPRDSYVEIPGGYGQHKINSAFGRAKNSTSAELRAQGVTDEAEIEAKATLEARKTLIATIQELTGVTVDHYAEVNLLGFFEITEAIGGVEVCLNNPVTDQFSGADFPAGRQRLSGGDALAFVRQRHNLPRGDLDRIVRQQVFLGGMADQVLSAGTLSHPGKLGDLVEAVQKAIVLDEQWDILGFAGQMQGLSSGSIEFRTIPTQGFATAPEDGSVISVDPFQVREFVRELTDKGVQSHDSDGDEAANAAITVEVRNTTAVSGMAARVLDQLAERGFTPADTGNADPRGTSVVRHAAGEQDAGRRVADALGGLPVEEDANLLSGRVTVLLGDDYAGPGAQGAVARSLPGRPALAQTQEAEAPIVAGDIPCID